MQEKYDIEDRHGQYAGSIVKHNQISLLPLIILVAIAGVLFLAYKAWPYLLAEIVKQFTTGNPEVSIYLCISMGGVILGCIGGFIYLMRSVSKESEKYGLIVNTMTAASYTVIGSFSASLILSFLLLLYITIVAIIDKSFRLGDFILTLIGMPIISTLLSIVPVIIVTIIAGITSSIYEKLRKI